MSVKWHKIFFFSKWDEPDQYRGFLSLRVSALKHSTRNNNVEKQAIFSLGELQDSLSILLCDQLLRCMLRRVIVIRQVPIYKRMTEIRIRTAPTWRPLRAHHYWPIALLHHIVSACWWLWSREAQVTDRRLGIANVAKGVQIGCFLWKVSRAASLL